MSDTAKYHAAAIAAMNNAPAPKQTATAPAPAAEPAKLDESKLVVEPDTKSTPEVAETHETKPEVPKDVKSDSIRKSFETLAREKAALRQQQERFKQLEGIEKALGPQGIHELLRAREANDVKGVMKALGIKPGDIQYEQAQEQIEEARRPPEDPHYEKLEKELEALRQERQQERYAAGRAKALEYTANLAKDPEFDLISDEPQAHDEALRMVEEYIHAHNEMPAETRDESIKLALTAVKEKYEEEAKRWEKRLTKVKKVDSISQSASPEQSTQAASEGKSRTLTNSSSATPAPNSTPRSAQDYQALAIAAMKNLP